MNDRVVGEEWVVWKDDNSPEHSGCRDAVLFLIRKLVEERRTYYAEPDGEKGVIDLVLAEFGIPREEWPWK